MASLMKGHRWVDRHKTMTYPAWVEIKSDEIRCHVRIVDEDDELKVQFLSFAGKPLANMEIFAKPFLALHSMTGYMEFDTGFEVNGNFNDSYRWVRSAKGLPLDLLEVPTQFYLFDLPELGSDFQQRCVERARVAVLAATLDLALHEPEGTWAYSAEDVMRLFTVARGNQKEGIMVKRLDHLYERKRTTGWLKVKPDDDADGVITELHEAICGKDQPEVGLRVGDPLGRIGSVTLAVSDDSGNVLGTATPHGIPHELGRDMFLNPDKYLGQWVEFKYMELDRAGGYRHPTFNRLRESK